MKQLINFLFEVGMLKRTPRTGYQFLGSGRESVAEHSFRTAVIGYLLSQQEAGADTYKIILMCLFHDFHEARTGDHNYVNKKYVRVDEDKAVQDLSKDLPFGDDIISLTREFNEGNSLEARISRDADQLDLILELKEQQDLGNRSCCSFSSRIKSSSKICFPDLLRIGWAMPSRGCRQRAQKDWPKRR